MRNKRALEVHQAYGSVIPLGGAGNEGGDALSYLCSDGLEVQPRPRADYFHDVELDHVVPEESMAERRVRSYVIEQLLQVSKTQVLDPEAVRVCRFL